MYQDEVPRRDVWFLITQHRQLCIGVLMGDKVHKEDQTEDRSEERGSVVAEKTGCLVHGEGKVLDKEADHRISQLSGRSMIWSNLSLPYPPSCTGTRPV